MVDDTDEGPRRPKVALPLSCPPRGLARGLAAAYIGVSVSKFDQMVGDGRMPTAKEIDRRKVWDRIELDEAFSALPAETPDNPWDAIL
jgi:predicted DNA-binding transcriptional regulator AlpA